MKPLFNKISCDRILTPLFDFPVNEFSAFCVEKLNQSNMEISLNRVFTVFGKCII